MKWVELSVFTTDAGIEAVCGALSGVGIEQVSIEESSGRVEAFLAENARYWDFADPKELAAQEGPCVKAYISYLDENKPLLAAARAAVEELSSLYLGVELGDLRIREALVDDEDWANSWRAYYKPLPIGARLMVCPSWEEADAQGRRVVRMDPGMVFGTGTHHTTRMCLETLEEHVLGGERLLDVGCGSGILAIAGLLLGAKNAVLVDIDPVADKVVRENAIMNGVTDDRYQLFIGDVLESGALRERMGSGYDMVVANIVADVIIALSPYLTGFCKEGGLFLCSGIIDERQNEVHAALTQKGFALLEERRSEGWVALLYHAPGAAA